MITIRYTDIPTDTQHTQTFVDPLGAAQCLGQIDLYDNLRLDSWDSDTLGESVRVLKIRERSGAHGKESL